MQEVTYPGCKSTHKVHIRNSETYIAEKVDKASSKTLMYRRSLKLSFSSSQYDSGFFYLTGGFPTQKASNADPWRLLCCYIEQAVEQTV